MRIGSAKRFVDCFLSVSGFLAAGLISLISSGLMAQTVEVQRLAKEPAFSSALPRVQASGSTGSDLEKRVAVTGSGLVSSMGFSVDEAWEFARAGRIGYGPVTLFDVSTFDCQIGFQVPESWGSIFMERTRIRKRERRLLSRSAEFAMYAALDALEAAGSGVYDPYTPIYGGVAVNSAQDIAEQFQAHPDVVYRRVRTLPPEIMVRTFFTLPATAVAEVLGFCGEAKVDSSACGSVFTALNSARLGIQSGYSSAAVAFGADAPINIMTWQAFETARMFTRNNNMRVLDRTTDLGTLGEGAAAFYLESLASAKARGASVLAEIENFAAGQDGTGYHYLPEPTGQRQATTIHRALGDDLDVDLIVMHAPGYANLEEIEVSGLRQVFGERLRQIPITTQSASHGQNFAAGSALKIALAMEMISRSEVLPISGCYDVADYASDLDLVLKPRKLRPKRVLVNGRGFGGSTFSMVLRSVG